MRENVSRLRYLSLDTPILGGGGRRVKKKEEKVGDGRNGVVSQGLGDFARLKEVV